MRLGVTAERGIELKGDGDLRSPSPFHETLPSPAKSWGPARYLPAGEGLGVGRLSQIGRRVALGPILWPPPT